jgi:hypothetical protein
MEKLCYVLWKPPARGARDFARLLVEEAAPALLAAGAAGLSVLAADAEAESVQAARITHMAEPLAGMVGLWLDCVDDRAAFEERLRPHVARMAGYLVTESVPRRNETHRAPPGARTPGITMLACLERPARLSPAEWIGIWHGSHTPLANEIQCTYRYVRNGVARALTPDAPPWEGIVEEGFPTEAILDPSRWYKAEGDPAKLRENVGRMIASVKRFLDIDRVESHPLGEWVLREIAPRTP